MYPGKYPPEKTAYVMAGSGQVISYGELEADSNRLAHLFRQHGLERGDAIALCLENHPAFFKVCWAALRAGLYFTAISYRLQAEEVEYIVNDCGAKVLITSKLLEDTFHGFKDALIHQPVCYMLDGVTDGAQPLETAMAEMPGDPIADQSQGVAMLYSSGTTGRPKGVRRPLPEVPFDELDTAFQARADRYEFNESSVYLSPAPLYHAAPLAFTVTVLKTGGEVVVMENYDSEQALALIEKHQITHSQWVPTMFVRMLKLPEDVRQQYNLSSHRIAIHAAAPCPVTVKQQMIEWWGPIINEYYAGTEGNGSTTITSEEWLAHKGSVGSASPGCEVHILDEDGNELPVGEAGGVYFSGGGSFRYHNDEEKTAASTSRQGYTTLGDVGYLDEDSYLYLTDRKSFMIISGGVNIYPQETENALITHPDVMDVAVFGVPNEEFGEEVKAVVQPMEMDKAGPELEAELIAWCREHISHIKCPRSVDFMEELPRHPTGKLYKRLLKDKYWP